MGVNQAPPTPEHDKLRALDGKNDVIGEFLDWLQFQGFVVATWSHWCTKCGADWPDDERKNCPACGRRQSEYRSNPRLTPAVVRTTDLLARYFEIDQTKLEDEKRQLLQYVREQTP